MSIFGFNQVSLALASAGFVASQVQPHVLPMRTYTWYHQTRPRWAPGTLLYYAQAYLTGILLVLSLFYFFQNSVADSWQIITGTVLFFVHIVFLGVYFRTFWTHQNARMAFRICYGILFPTAIAIFVCINVGATTSLFWVADVTFGIHSFCLVVMGGFTLLISRRDWLIQCKEEQQQPHHVKVHVKHRTKTDLEVRGYW